MTFLGFVYISIHWLVGVRDGGFWGWIVLGRVFFELSEDLCFVSWVSSSLVFALLSIYFLSFSYSFVPNYIFVGPSGS